MAEENQVVAAAAAPVPAPTKQKRKAAAAAAVPKVAKAAAVKKVAAPKKAASPAKAAAAAKPAAAKKPKAVAAHPTYLEMTVAAVQAMKERGGSSRQAILKYILANYNVGGDAKAANLHLKQALKRGITSGTLNNSKVLHSI